MAPSTSTSAQDDVAPKLVASVSARHVAVVHTALSYSAFLACLAVGSALHFRRIVKNQWYGWPEEWWPSVSATIGDWYPERNIFQILIAITSGPRFAVVLLSWFLARAPSTSLPGFVAACGVLRTIMCGGWVYITSSDSGDMHDVMMISYLVLNIPWMIGTTILTPPRSRARKLRTCAATAFFSTLAPLIYFYVQHKVHRIAGAYSVYAIFEWSLILLDVAFDSVAISDLTRLEIRILDTTRADGVAAPYLAPPIAGSRARAPSHFERVLISAFESSASTRRFMADSYLTLAFWTLLTALGPMIFYSSVWSMGLSGWEVLIFCTLSPVFLSSRHLRNFVIRHPALFQAFTLTGLAAFKIDDEGLARLQVVAFSIAMSILHHVARWYDARNWPVELDHQVSTFLVGLVASVLLKFANFSLNPIWPIMNDRTEGRMITGGHNTIGLVVGLLAWLDVATRPDSIEEVPKAAPRKSGPILTPVRGSRTAAGVGFGSLFFLVHWLYTDSGTAIAWTWSGYPISGPTAMPHGILTILAMSVGIFLSGSRRKATDWSILAVALMSSVLLYGVRDWTGFAGALGLATAIMAVFPAFVDAAVQHTPGSTFFIAFLVYAVLELASVWTVAYAFVPGGPYLRERSDIVLGATMAFVSIGFVNSRRIRTATTRASNARPQVAMAQSSSVPRSSTRVTVQRRSSRVALGLTFAMMLAVVVVWYRHPTGVPLPYHPEARIVTAGIWTVHFGMDGRMWESQRRMGDFIRLAELDIVGLLESDVHRIVGGNRDLTQYMASTLNMYADIGPGPNSHTWGCALLSKFPILNSTHHLLPSPHGELAPAIRATLDVYGELVDVVVAHNGQEEDPLDRELQSQELGRLMREAYPRPVIFLGYVVTKPHADRPSPYKLLVEDGLMHDVDPADDDRWCEYVLFRGLHRVAYARLNRGSNPSITDTELQAAKFVVPRPQVVPASASNPDSDSDSSQPHSTKQQAATAKGSGSGPFIVDLTSAHRVPEHLMPPVHRFPAVFKNQGVNGHYFHVLRDERGEHNAVYYLSLEEEMQRKEALRVEAEKRAEEQCRQQ